MKTKKLIIGLFLIAGITSDAIALTNANAKETTDIEQQDRKTFVKTRARCNKCQCSGYWGYYHTNGTYEGSCQNTDGWGHRCGHSPEHHGLRSW